MSTNPLAPDFVLAPPPTVQDVQTQLQATQQRLSLIKSFAVVATDALTISWDGTSTSPQTAIFQHGLGFVPTPFVFFDSSAGFGAGNRQPLPFYELAAIGGGGFTAGAMVISSLECLVDDNQLTIIFQPWKTPRPPLTLNLRYYLCREPSQS